jgi:hypothetical protein
MVEKILVPAEHIEHAILVLRGQKVLLDSDLAALYAVPVKALNRAVKLPGTGDAPWSPVHAGQSSCATNRPSSA